MSLLLPCDPHSPDARSDASDVSWFRLPITSTSHCSSASIISIHSMAPSVYHAVRRRPLLIAHSSLHGCSRPLHLFMSIRSRSRILFSGIVAYIHPSIHPSSHAFIHFDSLASRTQPHQSNSQSASLHHIHPHSAFCLCSCPLLSHRLSHHPVAYNPEHSIRCIYYCIVLSSRFTSFPPSPLGISYPSNLRVLVCVPLLDLTGLLSDESLPARSHIMTQLCIIVRCLRRTRTGLTM